MRPYGTDRLRVLEDGTVELWCRHPKQGWTPGTARSSTRRGHPGTAVLWDDGCYEVIEAEQDADGVRYRLAPFREEVAIGLAQTYDRSTELQRAADRVRTIKRDRQRRLANALAFFTGHLPGAVQQRIANETGASAPFLTTMSALAGFVIASAILMLWVHARIEQEPPPSRPVMWLAGLLALDAVIRFAVSWIQRRPIGSVAGTLGYAIYYSLHRRRDELIPPLGPEEALPEIELAANAEMHQAVVQWEPFITLLAVQDQKRLARFGYDYTRWSRKVAGAILIIATIGAVSSISTLTETPRFSAFLSLLTAAGLAVEQVLRLIRLPGGPAPSVLQYVIRPLMKKHLR